MTVGWGPLKSVYAGHAALHSIGTGLILTLLHSLPVYSHIIRLSACLFSHDQALCLSALCLSILALSGSLPVYSHMISLPVYSCTIRLTAVYSLTVRLAACLVFLYQDHILSLSGLLHVYSHSQACCLSILSLSLRLTVYLFSHYQARCLSMLTHYQAYCLSIPSLSLAANLFSCAHSSSLPVYCHTSRLTAYLFSLYQTHCHPFSLHQARCLCIHTLSGSLPSILTASGSLSIYSHTHVTVYLSSHPMLLRLSCTLAHHCIRALSGSLPIYSCTQTSHLSGPSPRYPVPTIRLAAYLALVYCLATARLTTNVLSRLSICSCSYPFSHSDWLPI